MVIHTQPRVIRPIEGHTVSRILNYKSIKDLEVWLRSADEATITDTAGDVTTWADKSDNGYDAVASVNNLITGTRTHNDRNVMDCDGASQMVLPSAVRDLIQYADACTIFAVCGFDDLTGQQTIISSVSSNTDATAIQGKTNSGTFITTGRYNGAYVKESASAAIDTPYIISTVHPASTTPDLKVNGIDQSGTENPVLEVFGSFTCNIGGNSGVKFLNGWIGEIVIFSRALAAQEVALIERDLSYLWGIAV